MTGTEPGKTVTQRAAQVVAADMVPSSADHWARLAACAVLIGGGLFVVVNHPHDGKWDRNELIIVFGMIGGGLLVAFTRTILAAAAVFLPWRKNGNGPPPPAEG